MSGVHATARRLLEWSGEHPVLSVYVDLDQAASSAPSARTEQLRSLIEQARREIDQTDVAGSADERMALRRDLEQVVQYLQSGKVPASGAHALAIFSSTDAGLFAPIALLEPTPARVEVRRTPYLEPMVRAADRSNWCVVLVNGTSARFLTGAPAELTDRGEIRDEVPSGSLRGGRSRPPAATGTEEAVDAHLRQVARELEVRLEHEPYEMLVVDGPAEVISRLRVLLPGDVARKLAEEQLSLDIEQATEDDVRAALAPLLRTRRAAAEQAALARVRMARGSAAGRAVSGRERTEMALNEGRVERLLLAPSGDGTPDQREVAIGEALRQEADVLVFDVSPLPADLPDGIGALLHH